MLRSFTKHNMNKRPARLSPKPMHMALAVAMAAIAAFWCGSAAFGQCQYEVTAIITSPPCPFGGTTPLIGSGLNENGEVVGYYWDCFTSGHDHAFFWSADTGLITLPKPDGAPTMRAFDINDNQQIVGQVHFPSMFTSFGFMYDMKTGEFQFLEPAIASGQASANAINNAGIVAGSRSTKETGPSNYNAVIWDTNTGKVFDLGVMEGPNSWASDINDAGQATGGVGTQFFNNADVWVYTDGELTFTGFFPKGTSIGSTGINSYGTVACAGQLQGDPKGPATQGALWDEGDWEMLPLTPTATGGGALAINDHRQAVGRVLLPNGAERGVLWQHGEVYILIDLVAPGGGSPLLERGRAINNAGQILARAATRAVLLTPIKVPLTDLNFDCRTDAFDLLILLDAWGPMQNRAGTRKANKLPSPDFNNDGVVDGADLLILLQHWDF